MCWHQYKGFSALKVTEEGSQTGGWLGRIFATSTLMGLGSVPVAVCVDRIVSAGQVLQMN